MKLKRKFFIFLSIFVLFLLLFAIILIMRFHLNTDIETSDISKVSVFTNEDIAELTMEEEESWKETVCELINMHVVWEPLDTSLSDIEPDQIVDFSWLLSDENLLTDRLPISHTYVYVEFLWTVEIDFQNTFFHGTAKDCDFILIDMDQSVIYWGSGDKFIGANQY